MHDQVMEAAVAFLCIVAIAIAQGSELTPRSQSIAWEMPKASSNASSAYAYDYDYGMNEIEQLNRTNTDVVTTRERHRAKTTSLLELVCSGSGSDSDCPMEAVAPDVSRVAVACVTIVSNVALAKILA